MKQLLMNGLTSGVFYKFLLNKLHNMITITLCAKQCNKGYEPINWAVAYMVLWLPEISLAPALWPMGGNVNRNMMFSSIHQGQFAMFMEEKSTSKCNINMMENMFILKATYIDYRQVRFFYLMSFIFFLEISNLFKCILPTVIHYWW